MKRLEPVVAPRLQFFIVDSSGAPVTDLAVAGVSSASYSTVTAGVRASAVNISVSGLVAETAAHVTGQLVQIDTALGLYAIDAPVGAALSSADSVNVSVTPTDATRVVYPVGYEIDVATSTRSDFDETTDTVARVTLVDTTTANTDMRGTDGANTVAPNNAAIADILEDTGTTLPVQINAISGGGGTGTNNVTFKVTDGTTGIQGATMQFYESPVNNFGKATDSSGDLTTGLDSGDWTITITKAGFVPLVETLTVSANPTVVPDYVMTQNVYVPNAEPELVNCEYVAIVNGQKVENETIYLKVHDPPREGANATGLAILEDRTFTSGPGGLANIDSLVKGAYYSIRIGSQQNWRTFLVPVDADDSVSRVRLNSIIGK